MAALSATAILAPTSAEAKVSKATVHYRDSPNEGRMCANCKFFIAGTGHHGMMGGGMMGHGMMRHGMMMGTGACQLVQGRISANGYCDLYAPLGA